VFKIALHHLAPDGLSTDSASEDPPPRELDATALRQLLGNFQRLDPAQNHTHDPHIAAQGVGGRLIIRLNLGKLFAYNARDVSQPAIELDVEGVIAALAGTPAARPAPEEEPGLSDEEIRRFRRRGIIGSVLLSAGLGLNVLAVYLFLKPVQPDPPPAYEPVTDAASIESQRNQFADTYATGQEPGSRVLLIRADGTLVMQVVGEKPADGADENYTVGRYNARPCLVVGGNKGRIDLQPDGSLLYSGDTYRRAARK
jgi:hypothetical protein